MNPPPRLTAIACRTIEPRLLDSIPGWFGEDDRLLFDWALNDQQERSIGGDLFEIGSYLGKSAIVLGAHTRRDETVIVCDIFEDENVTEESRKESDEWYGTLTRKAFEKNYLSVHSSLPRMLQMSSLEIAHEVVDRSVRFTHIDGCHLYDFVRSDLALSKRVSRDRALVVCDDYRTDHAYGAAAAIWEAIISDGFTPLFISNSKLYGSWAPDEAIVNRLLAWALERFEFEEQKVLGFLLPRLWLRPAPRPRRAARLARDVVPPGIVKIAHRIRRR